MRVTDEDFKHMTVIMCLKVTLDVSGVCVRQLNFSEMLGRTKLEVLYGL